MTMSLQSAVLGVGYTTLLFRLILKYAISCLYPHLVRIIIVVVVVIPSKKYRYIDRPSNMNEICVKIHLTLIWKSLKRVVGQAFPNEYGQRQLLPFGNKWRVLSCGGWEENRTTTTSSSCLLCFTSTVVLVVVMMSFSCMTHGGNHTPMPWMIMKHERHCHK